MEEAHMEEEAAREAVLDNQDIREVMGVIPEAVIMEVLAVTA
jgi:hypothetical protein